MDLGNLLLWIACVSALVMVIECVSQMRLLLIIPATLTVVLATIPGGIDRPRNLVLLMVQTSQIPGLNKTMNFK